MKKKRKLPALDKYIIFSFVCIILYTIGEHILLVVTGQTLDLLTSLFFGLFGGEVLVCALLKKLKLKQSGKEKEKEDGPVG